MKLTANSVYHIYNRGNNGESLFKEHRNYFYFKSLMQKYLSPHFTIYAYCLMNNHFHFMLKPLNDSIERQNAFRTFFSTYSKAINKAYKRTGSLFEDGYHSREITNKQDFWNTFGYIVYNPLKHGFKRNSNKFLHSSISELNSWVPPIVNWSHLYQLAGSEENFRIISNEIHQRFSYIEFPQDSQSF